MKMKMSLFAVVAALALSGCMTTRTDLAVDLNDPYAAERNYLIPPRERKASLNDTVNRLQVTPDSTSWWRQDQFESVATAEIREIHFDRAGRGVLVGALTGLASGAALGVLVSRQAGYKKVKSGCISSRTEQSSACENCLFPGCIFCPPPVTVCTQWSYSEKRAMADAAGALVGAALAGLVGGGIGHAAGGKDIYRFEAPVSTRPVVARDVEQQIPRKH